MGKIIKFENAPKILATASVVGKKENIKKLIDELQEMNNVMKEIARIPQSNCTWK